RADVWELLLINFALEPHALRARAKELRPILVNPATTSCVQWIEQEGRTMATDWYCKIMGEEWGPMSSQELMAVAQRGRLTRDDNVRRGNGGTWVRAELVSGLFKSAPMGATATSNHLAVTQSKTPAPAKRSMRSVVPTRYWIKIGHGGRKAAGPFC